MMIMADIISVSQRLRRRETRHQVEMLAHFSRGAGRSTVMLKDLTCGGARIEGLSGLLPDEAVSLSLPGCKAQLAFVAWAGDHCAGLEFAAPLCPQMLAELVAVHAVGLGRAPLGAPVRAIAA